MKGLPLPVKVVRLTVKVGHAGKHGFPIVFNGFDSILTTFLPTMQNTYVFYAFFNVLLAN